MDRPTQEQIKEFWEWCGFKLSKTKSPDPIYALNKPSGEQYNIWYAYRAGTNKKFDGDAIEALYPDIDLNNLFKYAVPKTRSVYLQSNGQLWHCIVLVGDTKSKIEINRDPALALFWALWQVKEASK